MTREELINHIKYNLEINADVFLTDEDARMVIKALEKEPCEDVAKERYEDLCEYFGGVKDILKHREDFKAWLGRVKWHIHKAEELYEKYEYKKEPCDDAISRQAAIEAMCSHCTEWQICKMDCIRRRALENKVKLPSVTPQPKTGEWIRVTDKAGRFLGWQCDKCGLQQRFNTNFCSDCGARMVEPQESEDK